MTKGSRGRRSSFLPALLLLGGVAAALTLLLRREETPPPPPGWTVWRETGATRAVLPLEHGTYAGGVRGLFFLENGGAPARMDVPGVRGVPVVNALGRTGDGDLWVGMDQGLGILENGTWTLLTEEDGLPRGRVASMAFTRDRHVWLGTASGAVRLPVRGPWHPRRMTYLTPEMGLQHDRVQTIVEDDSGGIWFGTYGAPEGGLSRFADGEWSYWTPAQGLHHANVLAVMLDRYGRVWAGSGRDTLGGVLVFGESNGGWRVEVALPADRLAGPVARSLFQDSRGLVWVGSEFHGLAILRGGETVRKVTRLDGLPAGEALTLREGPEGSMWIGTLNGLVKIDPVALDLLLSDGLRSPPKSDTPTKG